MIADPGMKDSLRSLIQLGEYVVVECFDFVDPASRSHPKYKIVDENVKLSKFGKEDGVKYENDPIAPLFYPGLWFLFACIAVALLLL
jgi:hypothetical protein